MEEVGAIIIIMFSTFSKSSKKAPCKNGRKCIFAGCKFGHPEGFVPICRFNQECKKQDECRYRHIKERTSDEYCKFADNCKRAGCIYKHPYGFVPVCRYDGHCKEIDGTCTHRHFKQCKAPKACECIFVRTNANPGISVCDLGCGKTEIRPGWEKIYRPDSSYYASESSSSYVSGTYVPGYETFDPDGDPKYNFYCYGN